MKNFLNLLSREFRLFWSNNILRLLFIGAPILYAILLGYTYQKGKVTDLPIIVVDEDQSSMSAKIIEMFGDNEVLDVVRIKPNSDNLANEAIELEAACIVQIPKNFEKDVLTRQNPEILTIVNTGNILTANYASGAIQLALGTLKAGTTMETLRKQGTPEALIGSSWEPFKTSFIKKYNRSTNYMYFLWPGVLATVLQQVLLLALALSFASEYENGTFAELTERTSLFSMIAVKVVPYLIMSFGIWMLYYGFTFWFRIPVNENLGALTLVAGVFVAAVCMIGILVSILIPNQLKATEVLMVVATPSFIISGFTWPLSQMPVWVQWVASGIPLTHFLKAFRILLVERGNILQTLPAVTGMFLIALIAGVAAVIALYFKRRQVKRKMEYASVEYEPQSLTEVQEKDSFIDSENTSASDGIDR
ncbi:MAG TPA: ABC transporter permease [Flavobacteriaceae bacterium]|nr:ABC transporter permease [Flavobacteriaceae bacterium]